MADEIEAKYRVIDHDPVRRLLRQAGAQLDQRVLETNVFFDRPDRSLRRQDCGLRIRIARPIDNRNRLFDAEPARTTLTYKGPRREGLWKIRQEIELRITDAAAGREMLEALGLGVMLTFEKRRESWRLNGCCVELDELPYLGSFVEIEGPAEKIPQVACTLGLADHPLEKSPYTLLLDDMARQKGLGNEIRFP